MIVRATIDDLDAIVDTLVESHLDYVWEVWALDCPRDERCRRLTTAFRVDLEVVALPHGSVWRTADATSVAVWLPSDVHTLLDDGDRDLLDQVADQTFGPRFELLTDVEAHIACCAAEADWLLATMGTRPDAQRRGLGSAVLRPMLDRLDNERATARLETSTPENVRFYERLGFAVDARVHELPHGAPVTWTMRRATRPGSGRSS